MITLVKNISKEYGLGEVHIHVKNEIDYIPIIKQEILVLAIEFSQQNLS